MKANIIKLIIATAIVLQCTNIVHAQNEKVASDSLSALAVNDNTAAPGTSATTDPVVVPTTTAPPPAQTTTAPPVVATSSAQETTPAQTTPNPVNTTPSPDPTTSSSPTTQAPNPGTSAQSTDTAASSSRKNNNSRATDSSAATPILPSNGASSSNAAAATHSSTVENNQQQQNDGSSSKTGTIAGAVVGGVVGLALIAGIITWLNRRGGCTSRTHRRDVEQDYTVEKDDFNMAENQSTAGGVGVGVGAVAGAMHSSDNLPPPSPFQHARRFVPPTTNPTGYMNLTDEEYAYHQNNTNTATYQTQNYQDYGHQYQGDYPQDYHHQQQGGEYQQQAYEYPQEYHHDYQQHEYQDPNYQQGYYTNNSNVTTPTMATATTPVASDGYHTQMKPDQVDQKPNAL